MLFAKEKEGRLMEHVLVALVLFLAAVVVFNVVLYFLLDILEFLEPVLTLACCFFLWLFEKLRQKKSPPVC